MASRAEISRINNVPFEFTVLMNIRFIKKYVYFVHTRTQRVLHSYIKAFKSVRKLE